MNRQIGYYVHHQGAGHRHRAEAIAAAFDGRMTLIGTGLAKSPPDGPYLDLPDDRLPHGRFDGNDATARPPSLHYAPLDHSGLRRRTAMTSAWIAANRPDLMVVDVSVEMAMLARLASVPVVYVRLGGRRNDRPHLDAFASAAGLLVPFAELLDGSLVPDWVKVKSFYAGNIVQRAVAPSIEPDTVLVVAGRGGDAISGRYWAQAAASVPDWRWRVIGPVRACRPALPNLVFSGWVENASDLIASAGVVIGAAGDGLVSAVLTHNRPFICLPEARAFDEQASKAARLAQLGAAVVPADCPQPKDWRSLIAAAVAQPSRRPTALRAGNGAPEVARWLSNLAVAPPEKRENAA